MNPCTRQLQVSCRSLIDLVHRCPLKEGSLMEHTPPNVRPARS
jgi:hypothetical protein